MSEATATMAGRPTVRQRVGRGELWAALSGFKREFWSVGLFSLSANAMNLAPSLYMLQVYDRVMVSQSGLTLMFSTMILVLMLGLMGFFEWARSRLLVRVGVRIDERLSPRLFHACFDEQLKQASLNPTQAFSDLTNLRQFLTGNGVFAFFDAPWLPIYLGVLFLLHPLLGWLGVAFAVILTVVAWVSHRLTSSPIRQSLHTGLHVVDHQQANLVNAEVIEALGMLPALHNRWWTRYREHLASQGRIDELTYRLSAATKFLRYTQQSLSLGAGGWLVIHGEISPGAMIAGNILMTRALQPIDLLVNTWKAFVSARTAFDRLALLVETQTLREQGDLVQVPLGGIELANVTAHAPGRAEPILDQVNLKIAAGSLVCVVGPSGSGKSTLARVMLGLWPEISGQINFDGVPLGQWHRTALGRHLGYLPQDVELMAGSLAQNIARFGELDSERVIAAARRADVHELILRFPNGYDTFIGESGHLLSAGQKQRVALARALYGEPTVIVLDEPNANLDDAGEAALVRVLLDLKAQGKTVVLMTHRLDILKVVDRVVVLNHGRVVQDRSAQAFLSERAAIARNPSAPKT